MIEKGLFGLDAVKNSYACDMIIYLLLSYNYEVLPLDLSVDLFVLEVVLFVDLYITSE
jgi:hypothetical protein